MRNNGLVMVEFVLYESGQDHHETGIGRFGGSVKKEKTMPRHVSPEMF